MAKELPYFKFEPNQWENGNIQIFNREIKGLFIDLCSVYWSRLGELPYALALQKHCNGDNSALQDLEKNDIIGVIDGQIIIEFLDEQLDEFQKTSDKRRSAANKRWSNASALQKESKSNAIREEEIRRDKKKEDNIIEKEKLYRAFDHLKLSIIDFENLKGLGYSKTDIDDTLDNIENYKKNKGYKNLFITAKNWLKKDSKNGKQKTNIANGIGGNVSNFTVEDYEGGF